MKTSTIMSAFAATATLVQAVPAPAAFSAANAIDFKNAPAARSAELDARQLPTGLLTGIISSLLETVDGVTDGLGLGGALDPVTAILNELLANLPVKRAELDARQLPTDVLTGVIASLLQTVTGLTDSLGLGGALDPVIDILNGLLANLPVKRQTGGSVDVDALLAQLLAAVDPTEIAAIVTQLATVLPSDQLINAVTGTLDGLSPAAIVDVITQLIRAVPTGTVLVLALSLANVLPVDQLAAIIAQITAAIPGFPTITVSE